jgi:hypothetical protein
MINTIVSPKEIIRKLVTNQFKGDVYFANIILDIIFQGNQNKVKVKCMNWNFEWGIDFYYSPVVRAIDVSSSWLFNTATLPGEVGPLKENILQYTRGLVSTLKQGLYKYACKNPPEIVTDFILSSDELIELSLYILE